jgi:predicted cupin superfamily sugar epimerase
MDAEAVIAALDLVPHPEGGLYRRTWSDAAGTAIYFLLRQGAGSEWHRVHGRAEIWHFYAGATVALTVSDVSPGDPAAQTTMLGIDLAAAERPQAIVPAGWWQCARTLGEWSLVGCTVAPPFSFDVFELAPDH